MGDDKSPDVRYCVASIYSPASIEIVYTMLGQIWILACNFLMLQLEYTKFH